MKPRLDFPYFADPFASVGHFYAGGVYCDGDVFVEFNVSGDVYFHFGYSPPYGGVVGCFEAVYVLA